MRYYPHDVDGDGFCPFYALKHYFYGGKPVDAKYSVTRTDDVEYAGMVRGGRLVFPQDDATGLPALSIAPDLEIGDYT